MIIGITGTAGAGKGTIVDYLRQKGFKHYSARGFIYAELDRRGLSHERHNTRAVANDLREKHAPEYIISELYKEAKSEGGDAIIESVRNLGELEFLQGQDDFYMVSVDADPKLRYDRIQERAESIDKVTFEQFMEHDKLELYGKEKWEMNIAGIIEQSDYRLTNEGTLEDLHKQIDEMLEDIKSKHD